MPVCRVDSLPQTIKYLQTSGIKVCAVTEKAETDTMNVDFSGPIALIVGSEEYGISNDCIRLADVLVRIPMIGTIESLNVSVSAGIIMHEVVKCR